MTDLTNLTFDGEPGDFYEGLALALYEQRTIEAARAIVDGRSSAAPSVEQLRVLLSWLDGVTRCAVLAEQPF